MSNFHTISHHQGKPSASASVSDEEVVVVSSSFNEDQIEVEAVDFETEETFVGERNAVDVTAERRNDSRDNFMFRFRCMKRASLSD